MNTYYEPQHVLENGRRLNGGQHEHLLFNIHPPERLVMVGDRHFFKVAVDVTDSGEYELFHTTEQLMSFLSYDYYAYSPPDAKMETS